MAGQEGFEPPALGFGVRCSTIRATDLRVFSCGKKLFCFLVRRVRLAERTELLQLQLVRNSALVFCGGVVPLLAVLAGEGDDISHCCSLWD